MDQLTLMMRFEAGKASDEQTLTLFSQLVASGLAWQLQGFYGRAATALIKAGLLSENGEILHPHGNARPSGGHGGWRAQGDHRGGGRA